MLTVEYFAQAAAVIGITDETVPACDTLSDLATTLHERHGTRIESMLCDEAGTLLPWIIVSRNGHAIRDGATTLADGDVIRFVSPISGG